MINATICNLIGLMVLTVKIIWNFDFNRTYFPDLSRFSGKQHLHLSFGIQ